MSTASAAPAGNTANDYRLFFRSWPKMFFLYPSAIACLVFALLTQFTSSGESKDYYQNLAGGVFLAILFFNYLVITFEFPRGAWLISVLGVGIGGLLLILLNQHFNIVGPVKNFIDWCNFSASPGFFTTFFVIYAVLFSVMWFTTRFDYWELTPNELVHHTGLFGDVQRFTTERLKFTKEIQDVFEFFLGGAGRIILVIENEPRPVILDNVLSIKHVEAEFNRICDARLVRVISDGSPAN